MTAIAKTNSQVAPVNDYEYIARTMIAAVDLVPGQAVSIDSNGKAALTAAKAKPYGVTLNTAKAGFPVSVLRLGTLAGFTITQAYGAAIYVDTSDGVIGDALQTNAIAFGTVVSMSDGALTKVLEINCL